MRYFLRFNLIPSFQHFLNVTGYGTVRAADAIFLNSIQLLPCIALHLIRCPWEGFGASWKQFHLHEKLPYLSKIQTSDAMSDMTGGHDVGPHGREVVQRVLIIQASDVLCCFEEVEAASWV